MIKKKTEEIGDIENSRENEERREFTKMRRRESGKENGRKVAKR